VAKEFLYYTASGLKGKSLAVESADLISVSAGAADAGKPVKLDASGKLDSSIVDSTVIDHSALLNLNVDSHPQYHDNARGDLRYFQQAQFLAASAGVADAGKPVKLDAAGNIDASMINDADIAHANITGLLNDDHTQYSLADGSRAYSAKVSYTAHPSFVGDFELVDKKYVDDKAFGDSWQQAVIDSTILDPTALTPVLGDRYLIDGTGAGAWAGKDNQFAEWNGSAWIYTTPITGMKVSSNANSTGVYHFGGVSWSVKSYESTTASLGVKKVGLDIQSDLLASGGLALSGNSMKVNVADFMGLGVINNAGNIDLDFSTLFNDSKAIKASDLASTLAGKGASILGSNDAGGFYVGTDVESILQEIGQKFDEVGSDYLADTAGITKGDLVYISSAGKVSPLSSLTSDFRVLGIALNTAAAGTNVHVLSNDTKLAGLTIAGTPLVNDVVYWTGTGLSTIEPTGAGVNVWEVGEYTSAGQIHVEIEHKYKL